MQDIMALYEAGNYLKAISLIENEKKKNQVPNVQIDNILLQCYTKANLLDLAIKHFGEMITTALTTQPQIANVYMNTLAKSNVMLSALKISKDVRLLQGKNYLNDNVLNELKDKYDKDTIFIPCVWPCAYGDTIIFYQFAKRIKEKFPDKKILIAMPLNRPELKTMADIVDFDVVDLTVCPEEADRMKTLFLVNNGFMNLAIQERMVLDIIEAIKPERIIKYRYFPILEGVEYEAGWRMWEERGALATGKEYLPKLVEQTEEKKNKITFHFRDAGYSDGARNINFNWGQDLVNKLSELYPDYEIVRLGDKGMRTMLNCRNASHEELTIQEQIKEIQESKLFIGCHSAPQHLAVACSDTPVIVLNQMVQETCQAEGDVGWHSYNALGDNVVKTFFVKQYDEQNNLLLPRQNMKRFKYETASIDEVLETIKEIL